MTLICKKCGHEWTDENRTTCPHCDSEDVRQIVFEKPLEKLPKEKPETEPEIKPEIKPGTEPETKLEKKSPED